MSDGRRKLKLWNGYPSNPFRFPFSPTLSARQHASVSTHFWRPGQLEGKRSVWTETAKVAHPNRRDPARKIPLGGRFFPGDGDTVGKLDSRLKLNHNSQWVILHPHLANSLAQTTAVGNTRERSETFWVNLPLSIRTRLYLAVLLPCPSC